MNLNDENLNTYDDESQNIEFKKVIKYFIFVLAFFILVFSILTIIFHHLYFLLIGLAIGGIVSVFLFFVVNKVIYSTYYLDYKKATKKIHLIHQISYLIAFLVPFIIFRDVYLVIGITCGLLLIRLSIYLSYMTNK